MAEDPGKQALSPSALGLSDAAKLLSKVGGKPVEEDMLAADIAEDAPRNADGTLNLVFYAAWLVKEMSRMADSSGHLASRSASTNIEPESRPDGTGESRPAIRTGRYGM